MLSCGVLRGQQQSNSILCFQKNNPTTRRGKRGAHPGEATGEGRTGKGERAKGINGRAEQVGTPPARAGKRTGSAPGESQSTENLAAKGLPKGQLNRERKITSESDNHQNGLMNQKKNHLPKANGKDDQQTQNPKSL